MLVFLPNMKLALFLVFSTDEGEYVVVLMFCFFVEVSRFVVGFLY